MGIGALEITHKRMSDLTKAEVSVLRKLVVTFPNHENFSRFELWLWHWRVQKSVWVAIIEINCDIIGWAAVALGEGWKTGLAGVYVHPKYRGRYFARYVLFSLFAHCANTPEIKQRLDYIRYQENKEKLFRPLFEYWGFKDGFQYHEEQKARESAAQAEIKNSLDEAK